MQDGWIYLECSSFSVITNSWSKLDLGKIIKLTYYWVKSTRNDRCQFELGIGSNHTTVDWYNFCREVCSEILIEDSEIIGGPGRVVEIDESKFGKRKYHRGKKVDGCGYLVELSVTVEGVFLK